jgi:1-aminocyclopropane-1-carboxylate deaminase
MDINATFFDKKIAIDTIDFELKNGQNKKLDILRLDKIHETISGNKWFKLKYNLLEAQKLTAETMVSFGGAYSNHLHALAYAGKLLNLKTVGLVRGEEVHNPTLNDCKNWGMELQFISREAYRNKTAPDFLESLADQFPSSYIIPEGGDNKLGQLGCAEILSDTMKEEYDIICCSVGTGTTISGIAESYRKKIWGFAPFKNAHSLKEKLSTQIPNLDYISDYHFGGFGKWNNELLEFRADFSKNYQIELDKIYTAKMFFGLQEILSKNVESRNQKILVIHTGGLQGNRSSNS